MKSAIASLMLLAGVAQAQYAGFIFFKEDDCPQQVQSETEQDLTFEGGTNICSDVSGNCPDGICNIGLSASLIGTNSEMPSKIGACPSSDCASDCTTWDVEQGGEGFRVDCAEFTGQYYFYLGN